jgi:beta-galactosidase
VGTVPSPPLAADLVRWLVPAPIAAELASDPAAAVTISSGTLPNGGRAWFAFNWSGEPTSVTLARAATDAITADRHAAGTELSLAAWSTLTLIDE